LSGCGKTEKRMISETLGVNHAALLNVMFEKSYFLSLIAYNTTNKGIPFVAHESTRFL
jgi:hypothetical protein